MDISRYWRAIAVLFAPPLAMLFVQTIPNAWLLSGTPEALKPSCYINQVKKLDRKDCDLPAATPNPKAKTGAQLIAMETKARAEFGLATAILVAVSAEHFCSPPTSFMHHGCAAGATGSIGRATNGSSRSSY
jgi:hypothetical protein